MLAPNHTKNELHVAVGVISRENGDILVAWRHKHLHQGERWEFPGGKLEAEETPEQALIRELEEELGIIATEYFPLIGIQHDYPEHKVFLHVFKVDKFEREPRGLQAQALKWVKPDELTGLEFPDANKPIISAARLPDYYAILNMDQENTEATESKLKRYIDNGLTMIRCRFNSQASVQIENRLSRLAEICNKAGIRLIVSGDPELVIKTGACGLHLRSDQMFNFQSRPIDKKFWLAASCHNSVELTQAEKIDVDFAVLGPVFKTTSHPESIPMGWGKFENLVKCCNFPVYGLGGLGYRELDMARRMGGQGIAGISGFLEKRAP